MASFNHSFPKSLHVVQTIAPHVRLDPSKKIEYLDQSLAILGNNVVTKESFAASQELQSRGIRMEFGQQRDHTDRQFEKVRMEFGQQRDHTDRQFEKVRMEFGQQRDHTDRQFEKVEGEFEKVRRDMNRRFGDIDRQFEEFRARHFNGLCNRAHDEIHPIAKLERSPDSTYVFRLPENFPKTVGEFWGLKSPDKVDKLTYLVRFYDIQGYEHWGGHGWVHDMGDVGLTEESPSSDESSTSELTLENAVHRYPNKALRALAMTLGLVYSDVARCMEELERYKCLSVPLATKRPPELEASGREAKAPRKESPRPPPGYSPSVQRLLHMTRSAESAERKRKSKEPEREYVAWDNRNAREMCDKVAAAIFLAAEEARSQVIEQLSRSRRSASDDGPAEQSATKSLVWNEGTTEPMTTRSDESAKRQSGGASPRKEGVTGVGNEPASTQHSGNTDGGRVGE